MLMSARWVRLQELGAGGEVIRYFDARTKRPAIRAHALVSTTVLKLGYRGGEESGIGEVEAARLGEIEGVWW